MKGIIINKDTFNISKRLKKIDKKYFLVFNKTTKKFEVHYKRAKNSLELVLPFNNLDARTIDYVLKTRIENREQIVKEIEEYNKNIEKEKNKLIKEKVMEKVEKLIF